MQQKSKFYKADYCFLFDMLKFTSSIVVHFTFSKYKEKHEL